MILGKLCIYETNLEYVLRGYQQEQGRKGNDLRERNSEGFLQALAPAKKALAFASYGGVSALTKYIEEGKAKGMK